MNIIKVCVYFCDFGMWGFVLNLKCFLYLLYWIVNILVKLRFFVFVNVVIGGFLVDVRVMVLIYWYVCKVILFIWFCKVVRLIILYFFGYICFIFLMESLIEWLLFNIVEIYDIFLLVLIECFFYSFLILILICLLFGWFFFKM